MNERIRELAEKAGFQYIKDEGIGWAGNHNASLPKFAELIVKECCEVVKWTPSQFSNDEYVKNIQKHFGVEE